MGNSRITEQIHSQSLRLVKILQTAVIGKQFLLESRTSKNLHEIKNNTVRVKGRVEAVVDWEMDPTVPFSSFFEHLPFNYYLPI